MRLLDLGAPGRINLRQRVLALRAQPLFEGLDDEGLYLLAENIRSATYRDGEVVAPAGQLMRAIHLVLEGALVVESSNLVRGPGEAYGALPILAGEPSTGARARSLTRTLEVPALAFESALAENHSLMRNTLRAVGARVLANRQNLPASPDAPPVVDEGQYYEQPRTLVEVMIQLFESPFGRMNKDALVDLARHMKEARFPADTLLWSIGDPSSFSLHIDAGRIRCTSADGRTVDVGRGFTIGVLDVWGDHVRVYEARAVTPLIAFRIAYEDFLATLETHPQVGLELLRGFARAVVKTGI